MFISSFIAFLAFSLHCEALQQRLVIRVLCRYWLRRLSYCRRFPDFGEGSCDKCRRNDSQDRGLVLL